MDEPRQPPSFRSFLAIALPPFVLSLVVTIADNQRPIAEELLSDYRGDIAEGEGLEDFVRLLDTFAQAGWPEALRMLWRLDEVFRWAED